MYKVVKNINPQIFRGYDIRGEVDKDLSNDVLYSVGRAYANFLHERRIHESTVGRDNRLSSEEYAKAFIQGLNDGGINTYDIGLSMTQIVNYSCYLFRTKGSTMISASHNPKEYNGIKLGVGYSDSMLTADVQYLKNATQKGEYVTGKGTNTKIDIYEDYLKDLLKHFSLKKKWKIVVDGCNTGSGHFYPDIFKNAGCTVIEQNCEMDGNFPLGVPDPTEVKVLKRVSDRVIAEKADLGFAFDTDGDRMSVVDENGRIIWMDSIVAIFAKDVLDFMPGSSIIFNTLCSRQVTDAVLAAGGDPVMCLTGYAFVKDKIREKRSPFGGELSGHIFFTDNYYGHDDGAYASLRLLQYLERKNQKLSEAMDELTTYISSPEIKFGLADDIKFKLIDNDIKADFKKAWPNATFTELEGVRVDTEDQMAIVRASQNGPYITLKFEGKTQDIYDSVKLKVREILKKYPEIDWTHGVNTHALD
ncbi:phosphomannomutase/phosphoglucomutase [Candidatus Woesebacteria bacterium]|nr:phosphomannomutase/phosphoglucomutase [Candidatus Woesebacteria bacterium]